MKHLERLAVGFMALICIIVLAVCVAGFVNLAMDTLKVEVEIFFAVILIGFAVILASYGLGLMFETWRKYPDDE